jgi:hypothetical protein
MGIYNSDTNYLVDEIDQVRLSVGSSSPVELFTGASRNPRRQTVRIYNDGTRTAYIGTSAVTSSGSTKGEPLEPGESISYPAGNAGIFAITASNTTNLIVTELS